MANNRHAVFGPTVLREAGGNLVLVLNGRRAYLQRQLQAVASCLFDNLGEQSPISGYLLLSGASRTICPADTYCGNTYRRCGK
jgi:hypothetical protein